MIWLGIDPGAKGGWAIIMDDAGEITTTAHSWDDRLFVLSMGGLLDFKDNHRIVAAVEKVGAMPHQGVTSMFNFGKNAGFIEGVLTALGIPYQLVPPATWKREFSLIGKDKRASIEVCKRLFPDVDLKRTDRCRTESDGMAESLLIAEWGRRHL